MSTHIAAPNPCLISVLLVLQSRTGAGPQVVFHYPPDPLSLDLTSAQRLRDSQEDESSSSESGDDSSSDNNDFNGRQGQQAIANPVHERNVQYQSVEFGTNQTNSSVGNEDDSSWRPAWEPLLGLGEEGLAVLLSPGRTWHKRKFEMSINNLTFVGDPVYARQDGQWRKPQRKIRDARPPSDLDSEPEQTESTSKMGETRTGGQNGDGPYFKSRLTMFHVAFVLDPPPFDYSLRVREMYENVAKKLSRVLRWAQARHDYVWQQAELIMSIRNKHLQARSTTTALYTELMAKSSLAATLANIYSCISTSKIASFTLMPGISSSLQIPPLTSAAYLPSLTEPPIQPGLWLSTATSSPSPPSTDGNSTPDGASQLFKMFTLLLRQSNSRILKDIQATGGPLAPALANFVAILRPTKSFHKLSTNYQISLTDIHLLARHFTDWRRGIVIPPLHQRDTYILSPNADLSRLEDACRSYKSQFPTLPSLPEMLHALSGLPKPWGFLLPSSDHKQAYYEVLAWLMRGGWLTQLRTFAFARVSPEIKSSSKRIEQGPGIAEGGTPPDSTNAQMQGRFEIRNGKRPSMMSRPSSDGQRSTNGARVRDNPKHARLVLDPARATPEESAWLDLLAERLTSTKSTGKDLNNEEIAEIQASWRMFLKYLNGHDALESIAVREGMKRKQVWELLGKLGLDFDHGVESPNGGNQTTIVTIRHW